MWNPAHTGQNNATDFFHWIQESIVQSYLFLNHLHWQLLSTFSKLQEERGRGFFLITKWRGKQKGFHSLDSWGLFKRTRFCLANTVLIYFSFAAPCPRFPIRLHFYCKTLYVWEHVQGQYFLSRKVCPFCSELSHGSCDCNVECGWTISTRYCLHRDVISFFTQRAWSHLPYSSSAISQAQRHQNAYITNAASG